MITTQNGDFKSDSPFAQRPWTWGYSGISVDQSRDGKTIVVGTLPKASVAFNNFTYVPR